MCALILSGLEKLQWDANKGKDRMLNGMNIVHISLFQSVIDATFQETNIE